MQKMSALHKLYTRGEFANINMRGEGVEKTKGCMKRVADRINEIDEKYSQLL